MKITATLTKLLFFSCLLLMAACQDHDNGKTTVSGDNRANIDPSEEQKLRTTEGLREDYVNENRVIWQKPDLVIDLMGELETKTVADIGAGSGFFSTRLARRAKKVIAIDIDPQVVADLDSIRQMELPESVQDRLEPRLTDPSSANLKPGEADVVLIVNTIIYIPDRINYLRKLLEGVAKGGKVIIIDFKKKRTPVGPPNQIRVPSYQIEEDFYQAGYTNIVVNDTALDFQYIVIAEKA
ncbi:MAG: class I SAM-dependent methyltransferase [Lewinella sp.]|nr:class I SAM-dependent methyltransferase [Lewinella sp.]